MKPVHKPFHYFCAAGILAAATLSAMAGSTMDPKAVDNKDMDPKQMVAEKKSTSIWDQQELTGDWGGERTKLREQGINFTFNDIGDFLSDVSGSQTHHATYFGRVRGTMDIDFKKLADVDGRLFVTGMYQYGRNLSGQYLDVFTSTSSIAGEESLRLDEAWYEQGFVDSKVKLKFGQIAAVNDFGATSFDIFMSDETGYAANIIFRPNQPFSPAGKPGAEMTFDLSDITKGLYVKGGGFTAYRDAYHPDGTGLNWSDDFKNGAVGAAEIGYVEQNTKYAGTYKLGMTINDLDRRYTKLANGQSTDGNFVAYFSMEKSVYHPMENGKLNTAKGLDVLFQALGAPQDRNPVGFESMFGFRYTGLIEGRDTDQTAIGLVFADASADLVDRTNRNLEGETALELTHKFRLTPWFAIQPDAQFIFDPKGNTDRSDIVVLGVRTVVNF